jgi:hypothetical protein
MWSVMDQISKELIQAGSDKLLAVIHKFINSICNKKQLPFLWNESITVIIHKIRKSCCNNYCGILLISTS